MPIFIELELSSFGMFELVIPDDGDKLTWPKAKLARKMFGKGYRLPYAVFLFHYQAQYIHLI